MAARLALHLRSLSTRFQSNHAVGDLVPLPKDQTFVIGGGTEADLQLLGDGANQLGGDRSYVTPTRAISSGGSPSTARSSSAKATSP